MNNESQAATVAAKIDTEPEETTPTDAAAPPPPPQDETLQDFEMCFQDHFAGDIDYQVKLYRVEPGNARSRTYIRKYINTIPDEDQVGENYGGGKFVLMAVHPITGKLHTKTYNLDPIFNQAMKEKEKATQIEKATAINLNSPVPNPLGQLKEMSEIFKNLMGAQTLEPQGSPMKLMEGITDMFTSGLKKMQNAILDQKIEQLKAGEPEPAQSSDLTEIIKLISDWGNKFIEARGSQEQILKQLIQSDPQFQNAQEDQDLIVELYEQCCKDPNIGKEKIDIIMGKLNIAVPPDEPEPAAPGYESQVVQDSINNG